MEVKDRGVEYFKEVLSEQLEGQRTELQNELSFSQFIDLADQLDNASSVSAEDLDLAEELLKQFSGDVKYVSRPQYIIAISDYVGAVFAIDDTRRIREADKIVRSAILSNNSSPALLAASTFASSFGIRICGAIIPRDEDIEIFISYFNHVSDNKFQMPIMVFRVCYEHVKNSEQRSAMVDELLKDVANSDDASAFIESFLTMVDMEEATPELARLNRRLVTLVNLYADRFSLLGIDPKDIQ